MKPSLRTAGPGVFFADDDIGFVDAEMIEFLKNEALQAPLRRSRCCLHQDDNEQFQQMIIALHHSSYVRPHRHRKKVESLHLIEGKASAIVFDDEGEMIRTIEMSDEDQKPFIYRMPSLVWHTLIVQSDWFIFHETTTGPFDRNGTEFPVWAPDGTERMDVEKYMAKLRIR